VTSEPTPAHRESFRTTPPHDAAGKAAANDRREIFGWMMYDWAASAFSTTVAGTLLGAYLTSLAQTAVGENGVVFSFGPLGSITAKSIYPFCVSASVFLQVFLLPVLGSLADYSTLKKRLMALFCYMGVTATCLMFFITDRLYVFGGVLFVLANISFGAAIVFYNAYLSDITTEDQRDKVSSRGFAAGYLGGGLLLALNLALVLGAERVGISAGLAVRISLLSAGLWWGGFALVTFARLRTRPAHRSLPAGKTYLTAGFSELRSAFGELRKLRHTLRYLIAYLFFNDGIQTLLGMSSVFLSQELKASQSFLLGLYLLLQFIAFGGALVFERIAALAGTKRAILLSLAIWAGIVIYAYAFLATLTQALFMGSVIALVLGGSQSLSRSLFSRMIPKGYESSFFGIYEVSERGTSWLGPLIFGIVASATNSYRSAIMSLIIFFVVGMVILFFTDTDRAVHEAGNHLPEEVGAERATA
jgi:UMF1 family MFS transporter